MNVSKKLRQEVIELLKKHRGNASKVCDVLKKPRSWYSELFLMDAEFRLAVKEVHESILDEMTDLLYEYILEKGDRHLLKWYLSTRGAARGYVEPKRIEISVNPGGGRVFDAEKMSDDPVEASHQYLRLMRGDDE